MRALVLLLLGASCSLALDWDPEGLPCLNGECAKGYSCLVNKCVADNSLAVGETCNKDQQCDASLVCAPNLFTCRIPCSETDGYKAPAECPSGEYCLPVRTDRDGDVQQYVYAGVCVQSERCSSDPQCPDAGDACVKISSSAFACLDRCEITWVGGTDYTDSCGSSPRQPRYCTPVGQATAERLVCLDSRPTGGAQPKGAACEPVTQPCEPGFACVQGSCYRHCNSNPGSGICDAGETCCAMLEALEGSRYGVCAVSCDEVR
jgi:hypothetical protein